MGLYTDIQAALDTKLATLSTPPPIAWENILYTPVAGTTFIRPTLVPTDSTRLTMNGRLSEIKGTYVIDVFTASQIGTGTSNTLIDRIVALFNGVDTLTSNSVVVYIANVSRDKVGVVNDWYMANVKVSFRVIN